MNRPWRRYTCLAVSSFRSVCVYLWVGPLERGVILVHLEVDLGGGDRQSAPRHQHGGHELSRAAQDHWACGATGKQHFKKKTSHYYIYLLLLL